MFLKKVKYQYIFACLSVCLSVRLYVEKMLKESAKKMI